MSLVDDASSSDDEDVPEPTQEDEQPPCHSQPSQQPLPPSTRTKSGSSSDQQLENKPHSSPPSVEKLPDASFLLNAPTISSNLMSASDHFSQVAVAQAAHASRKRDSNGMASSAVRNKVPRGNLPHSRNVPETGGCVLVPPQISGRKGVIEPEVVEAELVLPSYLSFKKVQMYEKYPKGQSRGRHWKHLKQIIQAENYQNYPPDEPNCMLSHPL